MSLFAEYQGKPIMLSKAGRRECDAFDMDAFDVRDILENGFDCPISKRKKGTIEKCRILGNKIRKVVVVDVGEYWLLTHVGQFTAGKIKR